MSIGSCPRPQVIHCCSHPSMILCACVEDVCYRVNAVSMYHRSIKSTSQLKSESRGMRRVNDMMIYDGLYDVVSFVRSS